MGALSPVALFVKEVWRALWVCDVLLSQPFIFPSQETFLPEATGTQLPTGP